MKHSLMHPAYPDLVRECAFDAAVTNDCPDAFANDNEGESGDIADPYLTMIARMEIAATRAW